MRSFPRNAYLLMQAPNCESLHEPSQQNIRETHVDRQEKTRLALESARAGTRAERRGHCVRLLLINRYLDSSNTRGGSRRVESGRARSSCRGSGAAFLGSGPRPEKGTAGGGRRTAPPPAAAPPPRPPSHDHPPPPLERPPR